MKTAISIFLAVLILFNIIGFYGFLVGVSFKAEQDISRRLDADQYEKEETITLKVPISIPYYSGNDEFERVQGEIEHEGEFYRLVKQRIVRDTLFIVCIKDQKSKHLRQALYDYVKTFTDKPLHKTSKSKSQLSFAKDYLPVVFALPNGSNGWKRSVTSCLAEIFYQDRSIPIFGPPPKM